MYEGQLVTFKLEGKEELVCCSLLDLDAIIDENGLLLVKKDSGEKVGYFENVSGINFYEMMEFFGFKYDSSEVDISNL